MVDPKKDPKKEPQKWERLEENLMFIFSGTSSLMFKVNTAKELGLSKSGKSNIIATSKGNKALTLPDGSTIKVGINIYRSVA